VGQHNLVCCDITVYIGPCAERCTAADANWVVWFTGRNNHTLFDGNLVFEDDIPFTDYSMVHCHIVTNRGARPKYGEGATEKMLADRSDITKETLRANDGTFG
jgi:hypothetical protein